uniref:Uncharacterized protein n=1 Tax=Rhizophora mucronata TaxID=61149 RepID=A0A2P2QEL1_RHIMU
MPLQALNLQCNMKLNFQKECQHSVTFIQS